MRKFFHLALFWLFLAALTLALPGAPSFSTGEAGEVYFTLLHTNDEHSALVPSPLVDYHPTKANPSLGGFARLAGAVEEIRSTKAAEGEKVILVSAGDYMGGSAFSWLTLSGTAPELSLMLEMGYDVVTIGNHEYDYGPEVLAGYLAAAGYPAAGSRTPLLASNTRPPAGHPLGNLGIKETYLLEVRENLKIGFLGLIGKDAVQVAPSSAPVEFADQHETARRAVEKLKSQGAHIIVAITHSGVDEDVPLARDVPGIDIIVGGHCHTALHEPRVEGETLILQTGAYLHNLGVLELAYDPDSGKLRLRNEESGRPYLLPLDYRVPEDPRIGSLVDSYTRDLNLLVQKMTEGRIRHIGQRVARADFQLPNKPPLQESPFGNFVADAMRIGAQEALGEKVDFAFQANGAIRGSLVPGSMDYSRNEISFYDLVDLVGLGSGPDGQPGYPLVSVYFTGEEIRRALEVFVLLSELMGDTYYPQASGLRMSYDPRRAVLFRVPIKSIPVPSSRAVLKAERYTGKGLQGGENFISLERGDQTLYHVVVDRYIASFLPMVGDMLPNLALSPKDKEGNPVDIMEQIIYKEGQELKVWQAVVEYASAQPPGPDGTPWISAYYQEEASRILKVWTIPLLLWPALAALLLLALLVFFLKRRRARKQEDLY